MQKEKGCLTQLHLSEWQSLAAVQCVYSCRHLLNVLSRGLEYSLREFMKGIPEWGELFAYCRDPEAFEGGCFMTMWP